MREALKPGGSELQPDYVPPCAEYHDTIMCVRLATCHHGPAMHTLCIAVSRLYPICPPGFQTVVFPGFPPGMRSIHLYKWQLHRWIERIMEEPGRK